MQKGRCLASLHAVSETSCMVAVLSSFRYKARSQITVVQHCPVILRRVNVKVCSSAADSTPSTAPAAKPTTAPATHATHATRLCHGNHHHRLALGVVHYLTTRWAMWATPTAKSTAASSATPASATATGSDSLLLLFLARDVIVTVDALGDSLSLRVQT
jgi:hypothetical protein